MTTLFDSTAATSATATKGDLKNVFINIRSFINDLLGADSTNLSAVLANIKAPFSSSTSKTIAYSVVAADRGKVITYTGVGGVTLTVTAAATLGDGFVFGVVNNSSGIITIDPNLAETVNGSTTYPVNPTETVLVFCDGTKFILFGKAPASLVTSVNSLTGAITAGQIAAAATSGYGYTPVNPANIIPLDANFAVGCFAMCQLHTGSSSAGTTISGSSLVPCVITSSGPVNGPTPLTGTWRNLSGNNLTASSGAGLFQRIA